ncbi:MAG: Co2+/Mg2+ efflux protein ApaG [Kordiimonas sp.]|nr:Co2+/Mg2+ efflux protein ApaG [Kordiimonas sp.]|tara:strand:- start:529 stop:939 length:411 start_codon:yes stop_codon:yes gene_type:complete
MSKNKKPYEQTTHQIKVQVEPFYLEEQSGPEEERFVWAYKVLIENQGERAVTLQSRYWKIIDGQGRVQEVQGDGVVGEQPTIVPGGRFEYTSGAPLSTPSGFMTGAYYMVDEDGVSLEVGIPTFSLDSPYDERIVH